MLHVLLRGVYMLGIPLAISLLLFFIHFSILTNSGPGNAFVSRPFRNSLIVRPSPSLSCVEGTPHILPHCLPYREHMKPHPLQLNSHPMPLVRYLKTPTDSMYVTVTSLCPSFCSAPLWITHIHVKPGPQVLASLSCPSISTQVS